MEKKDNTNSNKLINNNSQFNNSKEGEIMQRYSLKKKKAFNYNLKIPFHLRLA